VVNDAADGRIRRYYLLPSKQNDHSFMEIAPQHRSQRRQPIAGSWRRLGCLGATLALAVQLLLPFMAMPQASATAASPAAAWGSAALCTLGAESKPAGKQSPLVHRQCPICWMLQQTASLLPPTGAAELTPPAAVAIDSPDRALDDAIERPLSPAQPRGPPSV
jgi:hypothetical protein